MLTEADLQTVRDRSITKMGEIPGRCRLQGMTRDLSQSEIRLLAIYEAALITAFQKLGREMTDEEIRAVYPTFFQEVQQTVEGDVVSYNSTK